MKRRRSKYRIVVKTKAQLERERRVKAKKALLERQRAMDAGEIYSGEMKVVIPVLEMGGIVSKETADKLGLNKIHDNELPSEVVKKLK